MLSRQCLDRRVPDAAALGREVQASQDRRNATVCRVDWRCITAYVRIKRNGSILHFTRNRLLVGGVRLLPVALLIDAEHQGAFSQGLMRQA